MDIKRVAVATSKDLKQLAAAIKEIALMLDKDSDLECLQCTKLTLEKSMDEYGITNMEILIRLSLFEEVDLNGVE